MSRHLVYNLVLLAIVSANLGFTAWKYWHPVSKRDEAICRHCTERAVEYTAQRCESWKP